MKKETISWFYDVVRYTFIWALSLGAIVNFVTPLYLALLDEMGIYGLLVLPLLGIATRWYFDSQKTWEAKGIEKYRE